MSFPPPVVDVRSLEEIVPDPLAQCRKPPAPSPKSPGGSRFGKWAVVGAVTGVCLGMAVKVGVFAYAAPVAPPAVEGVVPTPADPPPISVDVSAPSPSQVTDLGAIPVTVVVAPPPVAKAPAKKTDETRCHFEGTIRVCRPDSVAATPRKRSLGVPAPKRPFSSILQ